MGRFALLICSTLALSFASASFAGIPCLIPPQIDPNKTFLDNFLNTCYAIPLAVARGGASKAGDLNATYSQFFFSVNPQYELFVVGEYPNARYFSVTPYDDHEAVVKWGIDYQIQPVVPTYINPFVPGNQYMPDQLYVVALQFGGQQPTNVPPGCGFGNANMYANAFNGTLRHSGLSWNGQPNLPPNTPPHDDAGPSLGGEVLVRAYLEGPDLGATQLQNPVVIARDLTNGCAALASKVFATTPAHTPDQIIATSLVNGGAWLNSTQTKTHVWYAENYKPPQCYAPDPLNQQNWFGSWNYIVAENPDASYLATLVSSSQVSWLTSNGGFMRIQTRVPQVPHYPCTGCSILGTEDMRYWSLSFSGPKVVTLATLSDINLIKDPNGYVTIIAGFGVQPPSWVTAANGYTYIDLSKKKGKTLQSLNLRTILPNASFTCSDFNVPADTMEFNPVGGYMGEYVPTVDYLLGPEIPTAATPFVRPNTCTMVPTTQPTACPVGVGP